MNQELRERLNSTRTVPQTVSRSEWTFSPYTSSDAGSEQELASVQADRPLILRDDVPARVAVPRYQQITDSSADSAATTHQLDGDLVESNAAQDLVVFADGNLQQVGDTVTSVDYDANTFDFTDSGASVELDVWYLTSEIGEIKISKVAPASGGRVEQTVFESSTGLLNQRDQTETGASVSVGRSALHKFVPEDWKLRVEVNVPYPTRVDDDGDRGATATNFLLELPVYQARGRVPGLAEATKRDISGVV